MNTLTKLPNVYCPFCGASLRQWRCDDDGIDFDGHARGSACSEIRTEDCYCQYSRKVKIPPVKPMCVNCRYFCANKCINKNLLKRFNLVPVSGTIADVRSHCTNYELNPEIFTLLINENAAKELDLCD